MSALSTEHGGSSRERAARVADSYFTEDGPPLVLLLDAFDEADRESDLLARALLAECVRRQSADATGRGMAVFVALHTGLFDPSWLAGTPLEIAALWIGEQQPNPFSCSVIGEFVSVALTWFVSKLTRPLPADHLTEVFSTSGQRGRS